MSLEKLSFVPAGVDGASAAVGWLGVGVGVDEVVGPSFEQLNPLGTQRPVYERPADFLRGVTPAPSNDAIAHVMATVAGYSYSDAATLTMMAARLGLERARCHMITQTVDAMFIRSTAFVLQSECGRVVVVSYRGTEPTNLISWLTSGDLMPDKLQAQTFSDDDILSEGVHAGFYRNVRSTRFDLATALLAALDGRPIAGGGSQPAEMSALYITGHSLGGAMAILTSVLLAQDAGRGYERAQRLLSTLKGVYTFGQPMVGSPSFARTFRSRFDLEARLHRYVYRNDPVPALPPALSGRYEHVGQEYRRSGDRWTCSATATSQAGPLGLAVSPLGFAARWITGLRDLPFVYSLHAHGPQNYINSLAPPGATEFGRPSPRAQ